MGPVRMNSLFRGNNLKPPFLKKIQQSCFLLANESKRKSNENLNEEKSCISVELRIEPKKAEEEQNSNGAAYELIVDYKLVIGPSNVHFVEKDCWKIKEADQLAKIELEDATEIEFCELFLNILQTIVPEDLNASSSFRNFNSSERSLYVNTNHLNSFGGRMFKEWFERNCQGEQSAVVQSLNADELEVLLKTCCQSTPIIHRRNFHLLLEIAEKEHIIGLLRLLESYLIDSKCIHPIRKLEYAAEYKMTRLATIILKSFPNRLARLDSLFDYLTENGESFGDVHLDVLEMLDLHYDYAIL